MTKLTPFDIEFFELSQNLKKPIDSDIKKDLVKKLLKLNNPTYFYKHVKRNPIELHGYSTTRTTNPVLVAITEMINILKTEQDSTKLLSRLQTEFAWAFNNYPSYSKVNL